MLVPIKTESVENATKLLKIEQNVQNDLFDVYKTKMNLTEDQSDVLDELKHTITNRVGYIGEMVRTLK